MEDLTFLANEQTAALVVFAFLQTDSNELNYNYELSAKGEDLVAQWDVNHNGRRIGSEDSGELESDGHLPGNITMCFDDILPLPVLQRPGEQEERINIEAVAQGLREIAAQFELEMVERAAQNLSRNIQETPNNLRSHLANEVERLMREGLHVNGLPQDGFFVAVVLILVKGVCFQAPKLLKNLFDTAVQFISQTWSR